jgi:hypothetical protein
MLRPVRLAEQWEEIQRGLPEDWSSARLSLALADPTVADRAAGLLVPVTPGRRAYRFRFAAVKRGPGATPTVVARTVARLDEEGIGGELSLGGIEEQAPAPEAPAAARPALASAWSRALETMPPDWSDLYCELELTSTDYLDRAALLCAPINPARVPGDPAFRFRCARRFGYGAAPEMVQRCLERLDAEDIRGDVRILRALSDSKPVATQGPVWYVGGKAV